MGYLKPQLTDLLKLPSNPEYWVRMRVRAPWGVRIAAQGSMMKVTASGVPGQNGGDPVIDVVTDAEWASYLRTLVLGHITEWNLTDADDKPLAITAENLDLLDDIDGQFLANEAQARSKLRKVEREKNLGKRSRPPSSTARK